MALITWKGGSGDWTNAADWSGGAVPGAADSAVIAGGGAFTVTLYAATQVANLTLNAAGGLFYDAGALNVGTLTSLQAGTLDLAYGSLNGGTLAMAGGTLLANGGLLNGVSVQGSLGLTQQNAALFVQGGLAMAGDGGSGAGTLAVTGTYAALDFLGTQILAHAVVTLGAAAAGQGQGGPASIQAQHAFGASSAATLTLAASVWLKQAGQLGQMIVGGPTPGPYQDEVLNQGTITVATQGGTLLVSGTGDFVNAGTIGVSNGATLDIASAGFTNTGAIVVADATLDFGGTFASSLLGGLGALTLSQASVEIGGDALNAGATLTVAATSALGPLLLAGTISGGTVLDTGGGLNLSAGTGVLDGVTYKGSLSLAAGAAVTLADSTVLQSASGGAGIASVTGAGAALLLEGQTLLDNATLSLGSNSGNAAAIATTDPWLAGNATTATLGPHLLIQQAGKFAAVNASATTPIAGFGLADTLVNQGSITGAFAGGTLSIGGGGTFINQGFVGVSNSDTLLLDPSAFSNTGSIAISGGATAQLGGPPDVFGQSQTWANSGTITVNTASLILAGAMHTAQLGVINGSGGTITLAGTLANAGNTLMLGAGGMLPGLSLSGTIQGGTILDPGGLLAAGTSGTALLDGVTDSGTLALAGAGAYLRVRDGLTLLGTAAVTGAGAVLAFQGSQTLDKAVVLIGASGSAATLDVLQDPSTYVPSTLTLGPSLLIDQSGALAAIGSAADAAGTQIASYATIADAVAGSTLALAGASFANRGTIAASNGATLALAAAAFQNTGTLALTNAALAIDDSLALSALGHLALSNASLSIGGTLSMSTGTLAIGAGSAWGRVTLTGQIQGGIILDSGQGLAEAGGATLNGVHYRGVVDLSRPFSQLAVVNGISVTDTSGTQPGTILLTGAASRCVIEGSTVFDNAYIQLGSGGTNYFGHIVPAAELAVTPGATLTLGPNAHVRAAGMVGWLGDCTVGQWTDSIVNNGMVLSAIAGGTLTIGSSFFTNNGNVVLTSDGDVMCAGVGFTNSAAGTVVLSAGSALTVNLYSYFAAPDEGATPFTNVGTLRMLGGLLQELTGNNLFPAVPLVNASGGLIQGLGNIVAPVVNNGLIEAKYGPNLSINATVTGTGTMQIDSGCQLELNGTVAPSETIVYTSTSETLRLDNAPGCAAVISGYSSGDIIDIAGTPVSAVSMPAGTLGLTTASGSFHLTTAAPLTGALSIGHDAHGGSTVMYTNQGGSGGVGGGTIVTLGVNQPGMLFWASSVGDTLAGTAANMAGTEIFNFSSVDSLDFLDFLGTKTTVAYAQASGQGTITVTDGTHTDHLVLVGSFTANWFHVGTDASGGALVTYKG